MPETIRIGVAGLGFGAAVHVPVFQSLPGVSVVALAGLRREKAIDVASKLGVPHSCSGFKELLSLNLDAISIALPPTVGAEAAAVALESGLGVLMEKPLAATAGQAVELARLAKGRTTAMNFIFTGLDTFRTMKKWLDEGRIGRLKKIDVVWTVESWANQNHKWSWKTDALQGGGVLTTLGSHVCFLADWFCGPVNVQQARTQNDIVAAFAPPGSIPAEHRVEAWLKAGEVDIHILLDNGQKTSPLHRWIFIGDRGTAVLENTSNDYFGGFTLRMVPDEPGIEEMASPADDRRFIAFRSIAEDFIEALRSKEPGYPDFAAGARSQKVLDSLREYGLKEMTF
jgi:predicted dehydrogenase